jgi:hypothetical protein
MRDQNQTFFFAIAFHGEIEKGGTTRTRIHYYNVPSPAFTVQGIS